MLYFHIALCFSMRFVFLFIFVFSLIEFMSFCWSLTQFSNNWFISFFCIFIWSYGQRNIQIRQSLILISLKMNRVVPKWPPNNPKVRFFNYFEKFWVCLWGVFLFFLIYWFCVVTHTKTFQNFIFEPIVLLTSFASATEVPFLIIFFHGGKHTEHIHSSQKLMLPRCLHVCETFTLY